MHTLSNAGVLSTALLGAALWPASVSAQALYHDFSFDYSTGSNMAGAFGAEVVRAAPTVDASSVPLPFEELVRGDVRFVYLNCGYGYQSVVGAFASYVSGNRAAMEAWVRTGGRLYLNCAAQTGVTTSALTLPFGSVLTLAPDASSCTDAAAELTSSSLLRTLPSYFYAGRCGAGTHSLAPGARALMYQGGNPAVSELAAAEGTLLISTLYNYWPDEPALATLLLRNILAYGGGPALMDVDGDGYINVEDNCQLSANPDQQNSDSDTLGDACDDTDGDGVPDIADSCVLISNPFQQDTDSDGLGDPCDGANTDDLAIHDPDRDGVTSLGEPDMPGDNCPFISNADQRDGDGDGVGDACDQRNDTDLDRDEIGNGDDNCPLLSNPDQTDSDGDGLGDACDLVDGRDLDGDDVPNDRDNCPLVPNPSQTDPGRDGLGDACDPTDDTDLDGDGVVNEDDLCPNDDDPECGVKHGDDGCSVHRPGAPADTHGATFMIGFALLACFARRRRQTRFLALLAPLALLTGCGDGKPRATPDASTPPVETCDGVVDTCGVCNGDDSDRDCNSECFGEAAYDCAGVCGGKAERDCSGVCQGNALVDCDGRCGGTRYDRVFYRDDDGDGLGDSSHPLPGCGDPPNGTVDNDRDCDDSLSACGEDCSACAGAGRFSRLQRLDATNLFPGARNLGTALAALGDVDGNGTGDFAVGAPHIDPAESADDTSAVWIVLMGRDGAPLRAQRILGTDIGAQRGGRFGSALTAVDDVDGDGVRELLVGEPFFSRQPDDYSERWRGRIWTVFLGQARPRTRKLEGYGDSTAFGSALSTVPDLNGDGRADVLMVANTCNQRRDPGREEDCRLRQLRLVDVASDGSITTRPLALQLEQDGRSYELDFGGYSYDERAIVFAVSSIADLNGDGRSDLLLSSPRAAHDKFVVLHMPDPDADEFVALATPVTLGLDLKNGLASSTVLGAGSSPRALVASATGAALVPFGRSGLPVVPQLSALAWLGPFPEGAHPGSGALLAPGDLDGDGLDELVLGDVGTGGVGAIWLANVGVACPEAEAGRTADCDGDVRNGCEATVQDDEACGACGRSCLDRAHTTHGSCSAGACRLDCEDGWADCNGVPDDGCELALATPAHCEGRIAVLDCPTGRADCDGLFANGCEVDTASDIAQCGACGNVCPATLGRQPTCAGGSCGTDASRCRTIGSQQLTSDCDGNTANGCEVCSWNCPGSGCTGSQQCAQSWFSAGSYPFWVPACLDECPLGTAECVPNDGVKCETPTNTRANCGGCNASCPVWSIHTQCRLNEPGTNFECVY